MLKQSCVALFHFLSWNKLLETNLFILFYLFNIFLGSVECNFSISTGSLECFGTVGQLLLFHLPNTTNTEFKLIKDNKYLILRKVKNQIVTLSEEYAALQSESELLRSGTLNLGNITKRHSGDYTLEEYGSSGNLLKKVNGQLEIQGRQKKIYVTFAC